MCFTTPSCTGGERGVQMPDETTTPGRSKEIWKHPLLVGIVGPIVAGVILFLVLSPWQDDPSDDPGTATSGPSGPTTTAPPPGKSTTTPTSGPSTARLQGPTTRPS